MIVLDTTVLVYATGVDHELASAGRNLISEIRNGVVRAHTTPEVIQEFAHVRSRRRQREDACDLARDCATLLAPLQLVTTPHLIAGLDIWRAHPSLGAFDAVLAGLALALDAQLVSADRAFEAVPGLDFRPLATFG